VTLLLFQIYLDLIRDFKIRIHGIPYVVAFTIMKNNVLDASYYMLLHHFGLCNAKALMNKETTSSPLKGMALCI
jgi:hypothetical protein